jgi:hypothetical protein
MNRGESNFQFTLRSPMHTFRERNAAFWLKLYQEPKGRPKNTSLCSELSDEEHDTVVRILEEIARAMIKVLGDDLDGARHISNVADRALLRGSRGAFRRGANSPGGGSIRRAGGEITAARRHAEASLERLRAALEGFHSEQQVVSGHIGHIG